MAGAAQQIPMEQLPGWCAEQGARLSAPQLKTYHQKARLLLVSYTKQNFEAQHAPDGTPWVPSKGMRVRGGGQLLRDRGILEASLSGGGNHVDRETSDTLEWGTNLENAGTHQHGATILPVKGKALAIPRSMEAYRAQSPANFPRPLVCLWAKGATSGVLAERGKTDVVHYLLVPKVTIPARPFLGVSPDMADDLGSLAGETFAGMVT